MDIKDKEIIADNVINLLHKNGPLIPSVRNSLIQKVYHRIPLNTVHQATNLSPSYLYEIAKPKKASLSLPLKPPSQNFLKTKEALFALEQVTNYHSRTPSYQGSKKDLFQETQQKTTCLSKER